MHGSFRIYHYENHSPFTRSIINVMPLKAVFEIPEGAGVVDIASIMVPKGGYSISRRRFVLS